MKVMVVIGVCGLVICVSSLVKKACRVILKKLARE